MAMSSTERNRRWRKRHPQEALEKSRKWYKANKKWHRDYEQARRVAKRDYQRKRRAALKIAELPASDNNESPKCYLCGSKELKYTRVECQECGNTYTCNTSGVS